MAYPYDNPYYPAQMQDSLYQPRPTQMPMQTAQQMRNSMIWVQGEVGARSYLVSAGNTVPLWDCENPVIYIKSVDQTGLPSMRVLDYTERAQAQRTTAPVAALPDVEYVTRKEFNELAAKIDCLTAKGVVDNGEPAV